jgi:hypothetical protein
LKRSKNNIKEERSNRKEQEGIKEQDKSCVKEEHEPTLK